MIVKSLRSPPSASVLANLQVCTNSEVTSFIASLFKKIILVNLLPDKIRSVDYDSHRSQFLYVLLIQNKYETDF
jgi:hypothetical protein